MERAIGLKTVLTFFVVDEKNKFENTSLKKTTSQLFTCERRFDALLSFRDY